MIFSPTLSVDADLAKAPDYAAWTRAAIAADGKSGMQAWRDADESKHFDYRAIRARLERLRKLSAAGDVKGLLFVLNEGIHGNIDGMGHERLYQKARFGTKRLIEDYVAEVVSALGKIAAARSISREEKRDFFRRAQHCYGRSALLLSGSGSFLYFHVGVVKALWDEGVLPTILAGSSGGSIVAAVVCTRKDAEVGAFLASDKLASADRDPEVRRLAPDEVAARLAELIPDLTFQEAYEVSGRHLNVSVAPAEPRTNLVLVDLGPDAAPASAWRDALAGRGVLARARGPRRLRTSPASLSSRTSFSRYLTETPWRAAMATMSVR